MRTARKQLHRIYKAIYENSYNISSISQLSEREREREKEALIILLITLSAIIKGAIKANVARVAV